MFNRKVSTMCAALSVVVTMSAAAWADPTVEIIRTASTTRDNAGANRPGSTRVVTQPVRLAGEIANNCPAFQLGTLPGVGSFAGSVSDLANSFGAAPGCGAPCGFYGGNSFDGIVEFTASATGSWTFSTCNDATVFDTALQLRSGGGCPGSACVAQDDDSCNNCGAPFKARLTTNLTAGETYFLIVDGYSGSGGAFRVDYFGPCSIDADCNDGLFCNGVEVCTPAGSCQAGTPPCSGATPFCNEATETCSGCTVDAQCPDDGEFCNGTEFCNLQNGLCSHTGDPCHAVQTCNENTNACDDPNPCTSYSQPTHSQAAYFPQDPVENPCWSADFLVGDDITLSDHAGRNLISYDILVRSRNLPGFPAAGNWTLTTELWSVDPDPGPNFGLPLAPIPGTQCTFAGLPTSPSSFPVSTCAPMFGQPTGIILPKDPAGNGVDFYIIYKTSVRNAGAEIAEGPRTIGSGGLDDLFAPGNPGPVFVLQDRSAQCTGEWRYAQFPAPLVSDFIVNVCTTPIGPCCLPDGGCDEIRQQECQQLGGQFLGINEILDPRDCAGPDDTDGDGTRDECDACPGDSTKDAPGQCGCGVPDTDSDGDGTADCRDGCPFDPNKVSPGICGCGNADDDTDGDGTPDCNDGCPEDPEKTDPGICGCGVSDGADSDGDGVLDCVDLCPGLDDGLFAPGCADAIPTVSEWGVLILALLLLVGAKLYFGNRPQVA